MARRVPSTFRCSDLSTSPASSIRNRQAPSMSLSPPHSKGLRPRRYRNLLATRLPHVLHFYERVFAARYTFMSEFFSPRYTFMSEFSPQSTPHPAAVSPAAYPAHRLPPPRMPASPATASAIAAMSASAHKLRCRHMGIDTSPTQSARRPNAVLRCRHAGIGASPDAHEPQTCNAHA